MDAIRFLHDFMNSKPVQLEEEPLVIPPQPRQSSCQLNCKAEEAAIKSCVNQIHQQSHNQLSRHMPPPSSECMAAAVAAWTKCCSFANENASP